MYQSRKKDIEQLEQRAKLSVVHENYTKLLEKKSRKNSADSEKYMTGKNEFSIKIS